MHAVSDCPAMFRVYAQFSYRPHDATRREKIVVVSIVLLLHLLVLAVWWLSPEPPRVVVNEMSVSFANIRMRQTEVLPQPKPETKPKLREPDPQPVEEAVQPEEQPAPQEEAAPPSPVELDAEPDYRADYLHNPKPPYPLIARRMGYQGTVVLEVEVLAEGRAGEVVLHKSCGYEILDKAAIQTVRTWRFVPARRLGQPITQRFLIPIRFSLEEGA